MRTVAYSDYLKRLCAMLGIVYDDILTTDETWMRQMFNRHMRFAWESYRWPELCPIESRTADVNNVVSLTQASETEIGEVIQCWRDDPFATSLPRTIPFLITSDGIQFLDGAVYDPTYIYFRKRKPNYDGDDYDAATAYAVGDQVYYTTNGRFYICTATSTGNAPTNTSYFDELEIPYAFLEYAVAGAYADMLAADGQQDKATAAQRFAQEILFLEIDKAGRQQSQQPLFDTFATHGTTQNRR